MRTLIAPDKFKGCLRAGDVGTNIARGLQQAGVESTVLPLADGGDGSVEAALGAGFRPQSVTVTDTTGGPRKAMIAMSDDSTAVIEVANTCGLATYNGAPLAPLAASSYGFRRGNMGRRERRRT